MFPPNDSDWIMYIQDAVPNNENPCWVDIVGDMQDPAAYYYLFPTPSPTPTEVAFRMRLNGDPLSNNPNLYALKEFVWGVEIRNSSNAVLFTISVNASGSTYNLQVRDSSSALIYNPPITLNNPSQPTDNVRVTSAGVHFPCASPIVPDEDYFLDFTLPTGVFGAFNFVSSTYRLCYFTSTQDNVINKEYVCGAIINPPVGTPVLCVSKQIVSGPTAICTNDPYSWTLLVTVYNCGTVPVNNVVLIDVLNTIMVLAAPPVFIPNTGISYNSGTRTVTWNIGTINPGAIVALTINLAGYFTAAGHYVLDSGVVNGTDLPPTIFADHGILVYGQDQLTADKQLISGPVSVEKCQIATWTFRITVTNTGVTDIPNVEVIDHISNSFTIESGPQLTPSAGNASFFGNEIDWTINNLMHNSSETLLISVTGFFSDEGHIIFDTGFIEERCGQTTVFHDAGIDILPVTITKKIKVCGDIIDCKTGELLNDVLAIVYDSNCREINRYLFDAHYCLELPAGIYSVAFEKEGYLKKFLTLILQSDMDIIADVNMAPKVSTVSLSTIKEANPDMDIFSEIVCEKIDAEIVYSSFVCLNSAATVESLTDVIDSYSCTTICESKLRLRFVLEKNLVYKLNQEKEFEHFTKVVSLCYPSTCKYKCQSTKCFMKIKCVNHCKERNIVYNIAYIKFSGYLLHKDDILLNEAGENTP